MKKLIRSYEKKTVFNIAVTIAILVMFTLGLIYIDNRIKTANQAQVVGQACEPFNVLCDISPPEGTDSRDYVFDVSVTDNSSGSFIWGSVSGYKPLEPGNFTVEVPVNPIIQSSGNQNFNLQCNIVVKKQGQEESCHDTFNGITAQGEVCEQNQCPDCACLEKNEIEVIGQNHAIKYKPANPSPTPIACYGDCIALTVKQDSTGRTIRNEMCKDEMWIGEAGTITDKCQGYTFSRERPKTDGTGTEICESQPSSEYPECNQNVCCSTSLDESCTLAKNLNDKNGEEVCPVDCGFTMNPEKKDISDKTCPTCTNGGIVGHLNQRIRVFLTGSTSIPDWESRKIFWGTFDNDFTDMTDTVDVGKIYDKGGVYKLKLECKSGNEVLTCEQYLPIICATCGGGDPDPSPSPSPRLLPSPSPSPTPAFCPVNEPINLEFKLECFNCGASPTQAP